MKVVSMKEARKLDENTDGFGVEAREWFSNTENDSSFASNCFNNREAKKMIEELYAAGAEQVIVGELYAESYRIKEEGDMYAAALFIVIQESKASKVKDVIIKHKPDECARKKEMIRCWWD